MHTHTRTALARISRNAREDQGVARWHEVVRRGANGRLLWVNVARRAVDGGHAWSISDITRGKLARGLVKDSSGMALKSREELAKLYAKLDPAKEVIVGDAELARWTGKPYRAPWKLPS